MKSYGFILSGICAAGCMASNALEYEAVSETNLYHIARIRKGMNERQAMQIMGKPYDYESFQVDDDVYDVWFYVTRTTGLDQTRMVPQNLTPLTFKNGILVGTGYYWYYFAMKEQANAEARGNGLPEEKGESRGEGEDLNLEKALKTPSPAPASLPTVRPAQPVPNQSTAAEPPAQALADFVKPAKVIKSGIQLKQSGILGAVHVEMLSKVKLGMSEAEVKRILGPGLNRETIQLNGDTYEVVFYEVSAKSNQPAQVVPFTFKNGSLVEMTDDYYNQIKQDSLKPQKVKDHVDGYDREADRMEEDASEQNFNYW